MTTEPPRPPAPGNAPRRPRRRRRGRSGQGSAKEPGGAAARAEKSTIPQGPQLPPPVLPQVSRLAEPGSGTEPLSAAEIAEMKEHLGFIRSYKDVLRLKLNAAEDLLVNGQREPSDRGVCRHLLGKVDRAVIEGAVGREPLRSNPTARARMLAGAIRLTADIGVLLAYLETLAHVVSRTEAAAAFAEVVRRIDFESVSANRLGRLLQVLVDSFTGHERVQVLFSLLAQPAFRRAFDAAAGALPPAVTELFAPLRAVHLRLLEGQAGEADRRRRPASDVALLTAGIEQILSAPDPVLRAYNELLRVGILELALAPDVPPALADRAASVLLSSLPRTGRIYARLALRRAAQLLARHVDDRARAVLEDLHRAQPGLHVAERWLTALAARRVGRVALRGGEPERGRLAAAFWLDGQRAVWVRTAGAQAAERLAAEARLQTECAVAGIAPVVEHGVASAIPYVAVASPGRPLAEDVTERLDLGAALGLAAAAARVLRALALAGVAIPDGAPERFLYTAEPTPSVILADLDGAEAAEPVAAAAAHGALAVALARRILPEGTAARLGREIGDVLERALNGPVDLCEIVRALDHAALRAGRDRTP
jgi:hypothetical protein